MSTAMKLFKTAAPFLTLIDEIVPVVSNHGYTFVSDDRFEQWRHSADFTIERMNFIVALELVEKAHLASMTALLRARRWADATCLMYDSENFLGWATAFRGFLESAGDTLDGLHRIPDTLALQHRKIAEGLGGMSHAVIDASEMENALDHFVHAKWMRTKRGEENTLKAKNNIDYVSNLDATIPEVARLYQQLCSICHPSNASIEYFFDISPGSSFKLSPTKDAAAIDAFFSEYPDALFQALQAHCVPPFLILRVLHKFKIHPQIKILNKIDWKHIAMAVDVERYLGN
jgi:hypothetical protein